MSQKVKPQSKQSTIDQSEKKMYAELASWWHLLSSPEEYAEEANFFHNVFQKACKPPIRTLLELGSGGGNNAFHLKKHFQLTLVDLSTEMLAMSKKINPECEHLQGDMRTFRINRLFDIVFIHDAIMYMTTLENLQKAIETAFVHCKRGGVALFVPDYIQENFVPSTEHGGHDRTGRAMRYLEWTYDPDENDTTYVTEYVYVLREKNGKIRVEHEQHIDGLFNRADWIQLLKETGFEPEIIVDTYQRELFLGYKP